MKKLIVIIAVMIFLSGLANAADYMVELKTDYFTPSEQAFKEVYGSGITYGIEISITVWKGIGIWAGADYFTKKGKTTFTEEETELQIIPFYAGMKFRLQKEGISPYIGLGIGYFQFKETNQIGKIEEGNIGYLGQVGFCTKHQLFSSGSNT